MKPLPAISKAALRNVEVVLTDVDGTLTTDGLLPVETYGAINALTDVGIAVVPVTGACAGWCDMIARTWPVAGVIGENGGFYFSYPSAGETGVRCFVESIETRARNRHRLQDLAGQVMQSVKGADIALDQNYRETDLAIDYARDVETLDSATVNKIVSMCRANGAYVQVSSVHINVWFGSYDKRTTAFRFARERLNLDLEAMPAKAIFVGDAPNDELMFAHFSNSIGVANVKQFKDQLLAPPQYVTSKEGGKGFVEVAKALIDGSAKV
jgi:HAD superfamily hydrolase (TIGR01484 family)